MSSSQPLLDAGGRRRAPATTPGFRVGTVPRNKGQPYPADPPTVGETVAVMRRAGHDRHGHRLKALLVVLWRAGLRIHEALSLTETDLDQRRGSILVRHGKNDRRREDGMDAWAWPAIEPRLADRVELPVGPLFCVIDGPTRGRAWSASAARTELHQLAVKAGVRRRMAPHQLRHAHAVELLHERIPLPMIQRLSAGDRHRGDHLDGPRAARADDAPQRRPRSIGKPPERSRAPAPSGTPAYQANQQTRDSAAARSTPELAFVPAQRRVWANATARRYVLSCEAVPD